MKFTGQTNTKKAHLLLLLGTILAGMGGVVAYQNWKRKEVAHIYTSSQLIDTTAGPVEYAQIGTGPALLIAHGTPGGYDTGIALAKLLADQNITIISPSRPGYLRTPLNSGATPAEQADLYASLLDTLGIKKTTILGISGGGPSALQFALRYPERCEGLITISAVTQHYSDAEMMQALSRPKQLWRTLFNKVTTFDPLLYLALPAAYLQPAEKAAVDLLRSVMLYKLRTDGYNNDMQQFGGMPDYPLTQITAPTLVIHGTSDEEVPFSHAIYLAKTITDVTFRSIQGAAHMAFYTHAHLVIPEIRAFLQRGQSLSDTIS
ncbi:MAG TPA: alpha/beta hydrolase [Dictyobacter sp.]|jgi:pimeloyl-ACP methyl ester carboxylesterase|nr:alpha/beta hydrolase [Dictyobacter sp.]